MRFRRCWLAIQEERIKRWNTLTSPIFGRTIAITMISGAVGRPWSPGVLVSGPNGTPAARPGPLKSDEPTKNARQSKIDSQKTIYTYSTLEREGKVKISFESWTTEPEQRVLCGPMRPVETTTNQNLASEQEGLHPRRRCLYNWSLLRHSESHLSHPSAIESD